MAGEKAFDPTAARLARARREGDVSASQTLNALASFGGALLALAVTFGQAGAVARAALVAAALGHVSGGAFATLGGTVLLVLLGASAGASLATVAQTGRLGLRFPAPAFGKLSPVAGLKRMFSRDAALAGARALCVAAAVAGVASTVVPRVATSAAGGGIVALAAAAGGTLEALCIASLTVAAVFAVLDVLLERARFRRRLRMSFDEVKREHRQTEGDPQLRGRRMRAHRALVRGSIARVAEAAFVVCNPAHVAVALAYRPPAVAVPIVLVRAIDAAALEVKRRARRLGIPIIEDVVLARMLLGTTQAGEPIPSAAYVAVAAIVAALERPPQ